MLFNAYYSQLLTGIKGGLDILAATLNLAEADVNALHFLNLQLADLRQSLAASDGLDDIDTHLKTDVSPLTAA